MRFIEDVDYHILKRKRKKGSIYFLAVLSDTPDKNGRRGYKAMKSLKTGNVALARKRAQELLDEGLLAASRDNIRIFFVDFWTDGKSKYLQDKRAEGDEISPAYVTNSRRLVEMYFLPYFASRSISRLNELTNRNLKDWRNYLFENREAISFSDAKPRKLSLATINKARQAVGVGLSWATDNGMIPANPMASVKRVKEKPAERAIFEREHLRLLFAKPWPDFRAYTASMLAVTTGMRMGEIRGLLEKNLHLDQGYLDVLTNYVDGEPLKSPKWGSERFGVPVPDPVVLAIKQVLHMNPYVGEDRFVFFGTREDLPVDKHGLNRNLTLAMKAAEIPVTGRTFHSFRHTYVSLLRSQVGDNRVMKMVGHTNTATTNNYDHVTDDDTAVVARAVAEMW